MTHSGDSRRCSRKSAGYLRAIAGRQRCDAHLTKRQPVAARRVCLLGQELRERQAEERLVWNLGAEAGDGAGGIKQEAIDWDIVTVN